MAMRRRWWAVLLVSVLGLGSARAEIRSEAVTYQDGDTQLTGYLVWDDAVAGKRPAVAVVHEWWGLNDYAKKRAEMLAGLGYVAFAMDMYGDGKVTEHGKQAGEWMKQITANVDDWQRRAALGLEAMKKSELVDGDRVAAIGYCFGGATVMQMAYSGADLKGVVSFHGSLPVATEEQGKHIKARVMVAHGDADGFVPTERVTAFKEALTKAGADWFFISYGGAKHGFTNPDAGGFGIDGLGYDPAADARSWREMQAFLAEVFAQ